MSETDRILLNSNCGYRYGPEWVSYNGGAEIVLTRNNDWLELIHCIPLTITEQSKDWADSTMFVCWCGLGKYFQCPGEGKANWFVLLLAGTDYKVGYVL
uniref:Uncharacterized protein n=1 Tax=Anopheles albimanus TaxID=7167 RepID=A0A182FNU0_ANOAL